MGHFRRHLSESAAHRENQFQRTHLITAMSSRHFKYARRKSRMRGKTTQKNSESLPTQSSKASICDGMTRSHITRLGKRAHLQVLLALMEACELAATHVTLPVVIGLGCISQVYKSCPRVLMRGSTFTWLHKSVCSYFLSAAPPPPPPPDTPASHQHFSVPPPSIWPQFFTAAGVPSRQTLYL